MLKVLTHAAVLPWFSEFRRRSGGLESVLLALFFSSTFIYLIVEQNVPHRHFPGLFICIRTRRSTRRRTAGRGESAIAMP
jgi:hypothetical protein